MTSSEPTEHGAADATPAAPSAAPNSNDDLDRRPEPDATSAQVDESRTAETMRAVVYENYGSADVLQCSEIRRPGFAPHEVLVEVAAAGLDRGVWHVMTGTPYLLRLVFGLRRPKKPVLGLDVAGTVVEVGDDVTRFAPGDEVFGIARGSFAEYAAAREDKLATKPDGLGFAQAAVVPISGLTALHALRDAARLQAGQRVLIVGASGGVGSFAVQVAKALGATEVVGVCSTGKLEFVRSLGADRVIDYTCEDALETGPYDVIVDIGGSTPLRRLRRALTANGTIALVGGEEGGRLTGVVPRLLRAVTLSMFTRQRLVPVVSKEDHADIQVLAGMIAAGELTPALNRTYPLADTPDAMRELEAGRVAGKLAVTV